MNLMDKPHVAQMEVTVFVEDSWRQSGEKELW